MDNIQWLLDRGFRAYLDFDGCRVFSKPGIGYRCRLEGPTVEQDAINEWHALRAYQDEQRKKGVPILLPPDQTSVFFDWYNRDYGSHGINYMFYGRNSSPVIAAFSQKLPGNRIAEFTNFRWRAGYPKGGQNG